MNSSSNIRSLGLLDRLLDSLDQGLRTTLAAPPAAKRPNPAAGIEASVTDPAERQHAAGLMRINHTGEVCAQALYFGQAFTARRPEIREHLLRAADEETDHLIWCDQRLAELGSQPSVTNPLWYTQSWLLGALTGLAGDPVSLGFVVETERQVEAHLNEHLDTLPPGDERSRAIVRQMAIDEAEHGQAAAQAGGRELPRGVRGLMRRAANLMKAVVYRI